MSENQRQCSNCAFGFELKGAASMHQSQYECRRRAPQSISTTAQGTWPRVSPDYWCGEFEPAKGET